MYIPSFPGRKLPFLPIERIVREQTSVGSFQNSINGVKIHTSIRVRYAHSFRPISRMQRCYHHCKPTSHHPRERSHRCLRITICTQNILYNFGRSATERAEGRHESIHSTIAVLCDNFRDSRAGLSVRPAFHLVLGGRADSRYTFLKTTETLGLAR